MVNLYVSHVTSQIKANKIDARILVRMGVQCCPCQRMFKYRQDYAEVLTVSRITVRDTLLRNVLKLAQGDP